MGASIIPQPDTIASAGEDLGDLAAIGRLDYVRALIAARAPELTEDDLASLRGAGEDSAEGAHSPNPDEWVPMETMSHILRVVETIDQRLARLEGWIGTAGEA
jgi:hypothetical protein